MSELYYTDGTAAGTRLVYTTFSCGGYYGLSTRCVKDLTALGRRALLQSGTLALCGPLS